MSKPIIGIDIDEVLMPHFGDLISWYNAQFGTVLTLQDNHPTDPGNWGTDSFEAAVRRVHQFYDTQEFLTSEPFHEAQTALGELASNYELIVVTARDTILETVTTDWLEKHFAELFTQIHFTKHFNLEGKRRDKVEILREEQVKYFIDDSMQNVGLASDADVECILFGSYVWNQADILPINVTRCENWHEVLEFFRAKRA